MSPSIAFWAGLPCTRALVPLRYTFDGVLPTPSIVNPSCLCPWTRTPSEYVPGLIWIVAPLPDALTALWIVV